MNINSSFWRAFLPKAKINSTSPAAGGKGINKGNGRRPAHQQGAQAPSTNDYWFSNIGALAPFIMTTLELFDFAISFCALMSSYLSSRSVSEEVRIFW